MHRSHAHTVPWLVVGLLAASLGFPDRASATLPLPLQDPTPDSIGSLDGVLAAALAWASAEMVHLHPEPTSVVLNHHAAIQRARAAEDPESSARMRVIQDEAEQAAASVGMPVMRDGTFEDRWDACSDDPHTDACMRHSGEASVEVWAVRPREDGSVEVSLNLRAIVGGRDLNWGVRNTVVVSAVMRDRAWEVDHEVSRVSITLLHRPDGAG